MWRWFQRTGSEVLGWTLIAAGIVMLVLPGPGLLGLLAGMTLLARHYVWARRILDPLKDRAIEAARYGVATWPRIALSALGAAAVFAVGVIWWVSPTIPTFEIINITVGPKLPAAGWGTALGIIVSSLVAWILIIYSVRKYRWAETA